MAGWIHLTEAQRKATIDDYKAMQEVMIYGKALPFDELISQLKILEDRFRRHREPNVLVGATKMKKDEGDENIDLSRN